MYALAKMKDGGYILGGTSYSGISGDKTQASRGAEDYWIVKTDANGHYLWDKTYGGPAMDAFITLCATSDGGCIMAGFSASGIGGDKTQASWGGFDIWVVKVDSIGNKQWDKRYGGSFDESIGAIKQTRDGGYIMGGYSNSDIGGDKTEPSRGAGDYWIVKIDSNGIKQWDRRFGTITADEAAQDVIQTPDGGYLVGGHTTGDSSGDKTQVNYGLSQQNYWVVKTDSVGNKQWDKRFGGTYGEVFGNSLNTIDGNYMLGGGFLNSRLATRIRQKEGISYGVGSQIHADAQDKTGGFMIYAIYAPENRDRLEAAYKEEIEKMLKDGFTEAEIKDAKSGYLQSRKVSRSQDNALSGALNAMLNIGRTMKYSEDFEAKINTLTPEQINSALRKYIDVNKMSVFKGGDFANKLKKP